MSPPRRAVATLAGAMALPAGAVLVAPVPARAEIAQLAHAPEPSKTDAPSETCLAETICSYRNLPPRSKPYWTLDFCGRVARQLLDSSARHDLPVSLLLATMITESDLNDRAVNTTILRQGGMAKDSGLMGIRCVLDKTGHCANGYVRGLAWKRVMDPMTNIELGAAELARWRDGAGRMRITVRQRGTDGRLQMRTKNVRCTHRTHAYWAHYNHGPRYIDRGTARHYPHRVAVLYYALARSMNLDTSALRTMTITMRDPGARPRTADRPVEDRYRQLCDRISKIGGVCTLIAAQVN